MLFAGTLDERDSESVSNATRLTKRPLKLPQCLRYHADIPVHFLRWSALTDGPISTTIEFVDHEFLMITMVLSAGVCCRLAGDWHQQ
jgi:hypothetical protein